MTARIHVGDVAICDAARTNPYGGSLIGQPRKDALLRFKHGALPAELAAWFAPCSGGARRLTDPSEVDWETSGVS